MPFRRYFKYCDMMFFVSKCMKLPEDRESECRSSHRQLPLQNFFFMETLK